MKFDKKLIALVFSVIAYLFCIFIWWKPADTELIWFLLPVVGAMWQVGGTWDKNVRRIMATSLIAVGAFMYLGFSIWILLALAGYFGLTRLPFTLIGDSVHRSWVNWVWIWVVGLICGLPSIFIGIASSEVVMSVVLCSVPCLVHGIFGTLSNVPATKKYFPWKLCELMFGISIALPPAMMIGHA